jgi:hypothetical protein
VKVIITITKNSKHANINFKKIHKNPPKISRKFKKNIKTARNPQKPSKKPE